MIRPEIQLERMRSPEIRERIEAGWRTAVFACGAVEQHGPHLPLFVDAEHGHRLAYEVARRLGQALVAPTIRIGCSEHHMAFAGTISLRPETFEAVVTDVVSSLGRHGFEEIFIIPSHGGNFEPLERMLPDLRAAAPGAAVDAYTDLTGLIELWRRVADQASGFGYRVGGHADVAETAIMIHLHPHLVRTDLAEAGYQAPLTDDVLERIFRDGFHAVTPNGILGDARGADDEMGRRLIAALADVLAAYFRNG